MGAHLGQRCWDGVGQGVGCILRCSGLHAAYGPDMPDQEFATEFR